MLFNNMINIIFKFNTNNNSNYNNNNSNYNRNNNNNNSYYYYYYYYMIKNLSSTMVIGSICYFSLNEQLK